MVESKFSDFNFWQRLRIAYAVFRLRRQGYGNALLILSDSIENLIGSVFAAIERESLSRSSMDFDALDGLCLRR
jgi:hypothetical protein